LPKAPVSRVAFWVTACDNSRGRLLELVAQVAGPGGEELPDAQPALGERIAGRVRLSPNAAPRARLREKVVLAKTESAPAEDCRHEDADSGQKSGRGRSRMTWAQLLRRVFEIDVLQCDRCHARMQRIAVITDAEVIRRMRDSMSRSQGP
jgi:hypothetical protein